MRAPSEELQIAIHNCRSELYEASRENMQGTKYGLCMAEQHLLKAYEILQKVIPLAHPEREDKH